MKFHRRQILVALALALFQPAAGGVRADDGITWEECVSIASGQNPDISSARRSLEASRASYRGSFNAVLPRLSLSNSYSDSGTQGSGASRWRAQGAASVDLFNLGRVADIKSSAAGYSRAVAELRTASADLRLALRKAYLQLVFAQENAEVSRRIREIRGNGSELVTLRYNSGRESKGNMLRAKAQQLQAEADLNQAQRELKTARRSLRRQLGLRQPSALSASGELSFSDPPEFPQDEEALLLRRPDIAVREALVSSAEAGLSSARSSWWPGLSADYTRSAVGNREFPSSQYSWSAGGTLSLPIFGSGPTSAYFGTQAAKKNLERSREDLRAARSEALVDLETAWSGFADAGAQAKVQAALLEAARQRNNEADIRYASGLLSYDNWEIISSDRVGQERQFLRTRLSAAVSQAAWERALGKELGE